MNYKKEEKMTMRIVKKPDLWVWSLFWLFFYLFESYNTLKDKEKQLVKLEERYQELTRQEKLESSLVTKLKDEEYAAKYIRAKLQYSKDGEFIYNIPGLLPKWQKIFYKQWKLF